MKFSEGMTTRQKIEVLERHVLVHSMLYYEMNESVISDKRFDKLSRLLASKVEKFGEKKIRHTLYGYVFYDFDGTTGFDLIDRLNEADRKWIKTVATCVLNMYKMENGKNEQAIKRNPRRHDSES